MFLSVGSLGQEDAHFDHRRNRGLNPDACCEVLTGSPHPNHPTQINPQASKAQATNQRERERERERESKREREGERAIERERERARE